MMIIPDNYVEEQKELNRVLADIQGRKMKPKNSSKNTERDKCQTPPYALDPLLPFLSKDVRIWEPACGELHLYDALADKGHRVIATDLYDGPEYDFFEYQPEQWDIQLTNPPFSLKYKWLERSYALGKPFALLVPVEILGSVTAQNMMKEHGFEIMLLDQRIDFKMPSAGWGGSGAQFPTLWLTWKILPEKVMFGNVREGKTKFKAELKAKLQDELL